MLLTNSLFWPGMALMIICCAAGISRGRWAKVAHAGYIVGLVLVTAGVYTYPDLHGLTRNVVISLFTALTVGYAVGPLVIERHIKQCPECGERYGYAREGIDEGQADGELPEGEGRKP
jgi:hypothetical protein